jgi:hypothetical protein
VQQAEEAAAKAEAQRLADLGLVAQAAVVELELFQRVAQLVVLAGLGRVQAGEDLRLDFLEARQRLGGGPALLGSFFSSVMVSPTLAACQLLDAGRSRSPPRRPSAVARLALGREHAQLLDAG